MRVIMNLLANLAALYSLLILIRVMLTWFSGAQYGKPVELLSTVTDPYLDWWRRTLRLRAGFLDLSPIAAMAALSLAQSIFSTIARYGRISLGIILFIVLSAVWSAVSFLLGFCLIVLILRFIAFMTNRNIYGTFWRIIDTISQPLLYRISRILFGKRLVSYLAKIIAAIVVLAAIWIGGGFALRLLTRLLLKLPV
ncbi:MAG: YggT family protein [Treponema sp.]|nr:YggT family protein [Treponema sp.]